MDEIQRNKISHVMLDLINIPNHKLLYVLHSKTYVEGLWGCLKAYSIEHTKEIHDFIVEIVQEKLEGPYVEREWTENEYNNFVKFEKEA
jgi:hypothetical protein